MHKLKETIMHVVFLIAALVSIAAVALICVFLFVNGIPAIKEIGFGISPLVRSGSLQMDTTAFFLSY